MLKKRSLVFSVLMAAMMSVFIGFALSLIKSGWSGVVGAFIETAPIAFAVALPTSIFVTPVVQRIVDSWFKES